MTQRLKRLPAVQEIRVRSLSREDPLEKEMATHSSILAWRILWREEPARLQSMGCKESDTTEQLPYCYGQGLLVSDLFSPVPHSVFPVWGWSEEHKFQKHQNKLLSRNGGGPWRRLVNVSC